jgi:hypothetical protein
MTHGNNILNLDCFKVHHIYHQVVVQGITSTCANYANFNHNLWIPI